jgi:hypothetical protein
MKYRIEVYLSIANIIKEKQYWNIQLSEERKFDRLFTILKILNEI